MRLSCLESSSPSLAQRRDGEHPMSDAELSPLFDAALPEDAPGAWIRSAISRASATPPSRLGSTLPREHGTRNGFGHGRMFRTSDLPVPAAPVDGSHPIE